MGVKAVGALQFNEQEMDALAKIDILPSSLEIGDNAVQSYEFRLNRADSKESPKEEIRKDEQNGDGDGLRQRKIAKDIEDEDVNKTANGVQELSINGDVNGESEAKEQPKVKDPIKWFGLLVPQALRDSQKNFKLAIEVATEIASLKNQLEELRIKFRSMLKAKEDVINSVQI